MLLKKLGYILIGLLLFMSFGYSASASDDPPVDNGTYLPKVKLYSDPTIELKAGDKKDFIIEVKNIGTGRADNFFIQAVPGPDDPFTISPFIMGGSSTLQSGVSKMIRLSVSVEKGAAGKVYPVKLEYSYVSSEGQIYTETDTLNIKIDNAKPTANIRLYNFELSPSSLNAGETGVISFNYMNMGSVVENNVRISLEGLDSSAITIPDGLNSQVFTGVQPYAEETASFKIKAASSCKNGVYPITIATAVKDSSGETSTDELQYFINVGGEAASGDAILDVVNKSGPQGTYLVGESFDASFTLTNTSKFDANNLLVKVVTAEGSVIVPTSQSMVMTRTLAAGKSQDYLFSFAATSEAKSQNYPITLSIEYDQETKAESKISFSQFFGVNISNPDKDKEEEDEKEKNKPKIIVSSYKCDPVIVKAGEEFDLNMTFMNTHSEKSVKNIKVSLTVTDKDEKVGASIFSPVNASNTIYIDQIAPKQTESRSIRYYAIPDAKPQTYSITVNFEYEDSVGVGIEAHEIVGINVSQPPNIDTSEITMPTAGEVGIPMFINFEIFNTGNVDVKNMKVVLEGDMQSDSGKTIWIGNFEHGSNEYVETSFYYPETGAKNGKLIISYDSATGEHFEIPNEFSVMVSETPPMEMDMPMDMPQEETGFLAVIKSYIWIIAGVAVVAGVAGFFGFRHYKKKKRQADDNFFE